MDSVKNTSEISILSILTNFGCHFSCPYCVYKNNNINIPKTKVDSFGWEELENELKNYKENLISISGGGDPLYNYENNKEFYDKLFDLLDKYNIGLELHTSIIDYTFPYKKCKRVVFHCITPTQIEGIVYLRYLLGLENIIRVVFVVQEHFNEYIVKEIVRLIKKYHINELSFRQMIGADGKPTYTLYDYLKNGHKDDWYYIEQCDYNRYFVHNHIEEEYLKIK